MACDEVEGGFSVTPLRATGPSRILKMLEDNACCWGSWPEHIGSADDDCARVAGDGYATTATLCLPE